MLLLGCTPGADQAATTHQGMVHERAGALPQVEGATYTETYDQDTETLTRDYQDVTCQEVIRAYRDRGLTLLGESSEDGTSLSVEAGSCMDVPGSALVVVVADQGTFGALLRIEADSYQVTIMRARDTSAPGRGGGLSA